MATPTQLAFNLDRNPKLAHLPALDGLRALAILAVMLFHFSDKRFFPGGGIVGVDLFFVLSGFLITTLLLQEWVKNGHISLKRFYQRRVLRLAPALAFFLAVFTGVTLVFGAAEFTGRPSPIHLALTLLAVVTYTLNWIQAFGGSSVMGLSHLWSLSIEEQFYLLWPAWLLLLLRRKSSVTSIVSLTFLIICLSALLPLLLNEPKNRFYYGTDFRLQALLLGALLAELYVSGVLQAAFTRRAFFTIALFASGAFLLASSLLVTDRSAFLFHGGHSGVAISAGVLVISCMFAQQTRWIGVLSHPVLVYIGQRSYALYIWHFAISDWLQSLDIVPHMLLAFGLSLLAAELSFRLIEAPALRLKARLGGSAPSTATPEIVASSSPATAA